MAFYVGHIVQMCHDYDHVHLGEAMEWAAESGHKKVVRLYRELGTSKFDSAMLWATSSGHENIMQLFHNWGLPISSNLWSGLQMIVVKMRCDYVVSGEPPTLTSGGYGYTVHLCYNWGAEESTWLPTSNRLCCALQAMVTNL